MCGVGKFGFSIQYHAFSEGIYANFSTAAVFIFSLLVNRMKLVFAINTLNKICWLCGRWDVDRKIFFLFMQLLVS
jgi:hypothetical protein